MRDLSRQMIIASAGSGKTYTISCRYIRLLAFGVEPETIFAATFTRKAAGEILDRILTLLAGAALDDDLCAELALNAKIPELDRRLALRLLASLCRRVHRLNIGTIDSFFVRTAQAFGLELGLPPGWGIASEPLDEQLRVEAVHRMLRDDDPRPLVELMRHVHLGEARRSVHEALVSLIGELHHVYQQAGHAAWTWWRDAAPDPGDLLGDSELAHVIDAVAHIDPPINKSNKQPSANWVKALGNIVACAQAGDWKGLVGQTLIERVQSDADAFDRKPITDAVRDTLRPLIVYAVASLVRMYGDKTLAAKQVLERFDYDYRILQRQHRAYRFDDVTQLLTGRDVATDPADIYYRLDGRIAHMLLDEFQDTSLQQWDALEPIATEVMQGGADRATLVVADPKQSIYGWRGGEPKLLDKIERDNGLIRDTLDKSYRSSPVVIELVNRVFGHLEHNPVLAGREEVTADWSQSFTEHRTAKKHLPGHVRLATAREAAEGEKQWAVTLRHAAELVRELHGQTPGRSIGVLTRTNDAVRRTIFELRGMGVTCSEEGGNPLTDSAPVTAVLSLLRMADHPGDTIARFHVASTPLGGVVAFTDHTDIIRAHTLAHEVRDALLVDGYGQTLHRWARGLAGHCDADELKRLLQLVELACRYEAEATVRPGGFVALAQSVRVEDPVAADVRVMTVHKSKGLEFDIVVLPELDKYLVGGSPPTMLWYRDDPVGPITRVFPYMKSEERGVLPGAGAMAAQREAGMMRDALSTLYVAVTRPRYALYAVVSPDKLGKSPTYAGVLRAALAGDMVDDPLGPLDDEKTLYEDGDACWFERESMIAAPREFGGNGSTKKSAAKEAGAAPTLATSERGRMRGLQRKTPSQQEGGRFVDLSRRLTLDAVDAMAHGTEVHEAMQRVEWADTWKGRSKRVKEILERPAIRAALSRTSYPTRDGVDVQVLPEHPFAIRDGDAVMTGVIDRLVLVREHGRVVEAEVLDYKTDREADVEHYRPQIDAYRDVVARMYGLDAAKVRGRLVFVSLGQVHEV